MIPVTLAVKIAKAMGGVKNVMVTKRIFALSAIKVKIKSLWDYFLRIINRN